MTTDPLCHPDLRPLPGAERQRRRPPPHALPGRGGRRHRRLGEAVTSWPDACRADRGDDRGHRRRERGRSRPTRQRRYLARVQAARVVVREPRRHLVVRALRDRHRALGSEGKAARPPGHAAPRGRPPRAAPRHREHAPEGGSLEVEADRHARYVNELGFKGCKLGLGKRGDARLGSEVERDVELIRLLRERIGPEPMLMWDRGVNTLTWDAAFAIRLTNALEEHGLTWIEEPFEPDDHEDFRRLKARCSTLVASGEREWNVEGYRSFIAAAVADVIGFDPDGRRGSRRPPRDRARRGGRRLVQRARLVERHRDRGEPRALADDAARARLRAEGGGEPDAARARRGSCRRFCRVRRAHSPGPASGSRCARTSSSATGSDRTVAVRRAPETRPARPAGPAGPETIAGTVAAAGR